MLSFLCIQCCGSALYRCKALPVVMVVRALDALRSCFAPRRLLGGRLHLLLSTVEPLFPQLFTCLCRRCSLHFLLRIGSIPGCSLYSHSWIRLAFALLFTLLVRLAFALWTLNGALSVTPCLPQCQRLLFLSACVILFFFYLPVLLFCLLIGAVLCEPLPFALIDRVGKYSCGQRRSPGVCVPFRII